MILQVSRLGWEVLAFLGRLMHPCSAAGQVGGSAGLLGCLTYLEPWLGQLGQFCPM